MTHPLSSADISIYSLEISNFCYIKKYRYKLHFNTQLLIILTFLEPLRVDIINMVAIDANLGLLKIKVFQNKGCDIIFFVHDVNNKILSQDSNYIADMVM